MFLIVAALPRRAGLGRLLKEGKEIKI